MVHSDETVVRFRYMGSLEVKSGAIPKCSVELLEFVAA